MPFLTVFTRCNNRPNALYANVESLARQTTPDYEQVFIFDGKSRGIAWANAQLREHASRAASDYVMVLDDDDMMADDEAIEVLKDCAEGGPEMIVFKMDHGDKILPDERVWMNEPVLGHIGMSSWIVRRDRWTEYAERWPSDTEADYKWLSAVWSSTGDRVWLDRVLTRCQNGRSWGAVE